MSPSRAGFAATALFAVGVAEVVIVVGCGFASDLSRAELNNLLVFSNAVIGLTLCTAGWPIAARRPRNPIGWLLIAGGISYASTGAGIAALACVPAAERADPWWRLAAAVTNTGWTWALTLFLPLSMMLFPNGRLPSRRWRPLLILPAVGAPILGALGLLSDFSRSVGVSGYGAAPALQYSQLGAAATMVATVAITLSYVGALACLLVRFRHGTEQVRRQLLWVLLALLLVVTTFVLEPLLPDSTFLLLTIALIPVAISVAVLRYQLLDIRVVFSRSLLYLLLTAGVIGVYLIVVAVLDQVVRSQVALGSSVLATLLVVVAFNPATGMGAATGEPRGVRGARGSGPRDGRGRCATQRDRRPARRRVGRGAGFPVSGDAVSIRRDHRSGTGDRHRRPAGIPAHVGQVVGARDRAEPG